MFAFPIVFLKKNWGREKCVFFKVTNNGYFYKFTLISLSLSGLGLA